MRRFKSRRFKAIKKLPFFPFVPIVPAAVFLGSLATSIATFFRVRRLERRLLSTGPT